MNALVSVFINFKTAYILLRKSDNVPLFRDEGIYNNEGMGRKSSKRCCIFHKQREFGESSTESSDSEDDSDYERIDSDDEMQENNLTNQNCDTSNNDTTTEFQGKIARKKMSKKTVPAYQRYHA